MTIVDGTYDESSYQGRSLSNNSLLLTSPNVNSCLLIIFRDTLNSREICRDVLPNSTNCVCSHSGVMSSVLIYQLYQIRYINFSRVYQLAKPMPKAHHLSRGHLAFSRVVFRVIKHPHRRHLANFLTNQGHSLQMANLDSIISLFDRG